MLLPTKMTSWQRYLSRTKRAFAHMPGWSVAFVGLLMIAMAAGIVGWWLSVKADRELLFEGRTFSASELATVELAFGKSRLFDYEFIDRRIQVPREARAKYLQAIADAGAFPREFDAAPDGESFGGTWFETRSQRQLRLQSALEKKLAHAVTCLGGIDKATVRFDERISAGLKPETRVSASVLVECQPGASLDEQTISAIRLMIAGERIGLAPDDVTVTDLRSRTVYRAGSSPNTEDTHRFWTYKRHCEKLWQQKIATALAHIRSARVTVTADLRMPTDNADAAASTRGENSHAAGSGRNVKIAPTVERLAVLVNIPAAYYKSLRRSNGPWAGKPENSSAASDELRALQKQTDDKIETTVKTLTSTSNAEIIVRVTSFDEREADQATAPHGRILRLFQAHPWFCVTLLVTLVVCCVRVLPGLRIKYGSSTDRPFPGLQVYQATTTNPADRTSADSRDDVPDDLRKKLSDIVRRDPQAAAKVLEKWMRQAG